MAAPQHIDIKRNTLDLKTKMNVLKLLEKSIKTKKEIAKEFNISQTAVWRILKQKIEIQQQFYSTRNPLRKRQRKSKYEKLSQTMTEWFDQMMEKNAKITDEILLDKSQEFAAKLDIDFNANSGWLHRWKTRENIKLKHLHNGDASSSSEEEDEDPLKIILPVTIFQHSDKPVMTKQGSDMKRNTLDLKTKINVLECLEKSNKSRKEIAEEFNISEVSVWRILKEKDKLQQRFHSSRNPLRKRQRKPKHEKLSQAMTEWFVQMTEKNEKITTSSLLEKAQELATKLGIIDFHANNGWLHRWKTSENITINENKR